MSWRSLTGSHLLPDGRVLPVSETYLNLGPNFTPLATARLRPSVMRAWINSRSNRNAIPYYDGDISNYRLDVYSACARSTAVLPRGFPVLPDFLTRRIQPPAWSGLRHDGGFDGLPVRGNCHLRSVFAFLEGCQSRAGTLQKMPETTRF